MVLVCPECGLPLITFLHSDLVVTPADIQLRKVMRAPETVYEIGNKGEWVDILDCLCIKCPVVLNQSEGSILLLDKEYWCRHRGFGMSNASRG